jgi:hypothetical protein
MISREKWRTQRKNCSSATSSTMNLTWSHSGLNPGLLGEKVASSHLSYGMAIIYENKSLTCGKIHIYWNCLHHLRPNHILSNFPNNSYHWKQAHDIKFISEHNDVFIHCILFKRQADANLSTNVQWELQQTNVNQWNFLDKHKQNCIYIHQVVLELKNMERQIDRTMNTASQ